MFKIWKYIRIQKRLLRIRKRNKNEIWKYRYSNLEIFSELKTEWKWATVLETRRTMLENVLAMNKSDEENAGTVF